MKPHRTHSSWPTWIGLAIVAAMAAMAAVANAAPAEIQRPPMVAIPDLAVEKIDFKVVQNKTWADGTTPCQIYNLIATVANVGGKASGESRVRIDRKKPHWELGCLECTMNVRSLAPNERLQLEPRQFNNCGEGASNDFRVVIDPLGRPDAKTANNTMEKTYVPKPILSKPPLVERKKVEGR